MNLPREIDSTVTTTHFSRRQGTISLRPCEIEITLLTNPLSIRTPIARTHKEGEVEEAPAVCVKAAEEVEDRNFDETRVVRAAVVVQNFVRCFQAKQGVRKDQQVAACKLQRWWAKEIAGKMRKSSEAEATQKLSFAVLQAKARNNYNLSRLATYEIQKCARRHLSREMYIKQIAVCMKLHRAVWLMWTKRQEAKRKWQQRVATATVLQRWFRSRSWNKLKPVVLKDEEQEIETGE